MTDIAPYQPQPDTHQDIAVHRLMEWAQSADAAYKVATRLVESSFVPQAFRGKPVEATAAILAGIEIGLSPMSALKAFDIIGGQAAPRAITQRAVALAHGHSIVLVESTATRCRIKCRRKGDTDWQPINWTIDRAQTLGLTGKDAWKKQPTAMLLARATSEAARLVAPDALLGIAYSVEELIDGGSYAQVADEETVTKPASTRMRRLRTAPEPDPEPEPDNGERKRPLTEAERFAAYDEITEEDRKGESPPKPTTRRMSTRRKKAEPIAEAEPVPVPTDQPGTPEHDAGPEMITQAQLKKLHAVFGDLGISDRDDRLAMASRIIGRQVETSNDLTKAEATTLIDQLEAEAGGWLGEEPTS